MLDISLAGILAIATIVLAYLGVRVSANQSQTTLIWTFIVLGALIVALTTIQAYRNYSMQSTIIEQLRIIRTQGELPPEVKQRRETRERLMGMLRIGDSLDTRCLAEAMPAPEKEIRQWITDVERLVGLRFGTEYAARLRDGAGLRLVVPVTDDNRADLCAQLKIRTARLDEFIAKLRD